MPRTYFDMDKILAELAWVTETPDPNKCWWPQPPML